MSSEGEEAQTCATLSGTWETHCVALSSLVGDSVDIFILLGAAGADYFHGAEGGTLKGIGFYD